MKFLYIKNCGQDTFNDDLLDLTFFSVEFLFQLSGYVSSQNFRIWSTDNPHEYAEIPCQVQLLTRV